MKISICIPQYNRTQYILLALESIRKQSYRNIEVVISDDCSTDESHGVLPAALRMMGLEHKYIWQEKNIGYDKNLRMALEGATGDYLFIMGNDDVLADNQVIEDVVRILQAAGCPEVAMGNVPDWADAESRERRCHFTGVVGSGLETALKTFRSFTIVTGLMLRRDVFQKVNTGKYDSSIYVQVYFMTRAVAEGGRLLMIDRRVALLGLRLDGKHANSWIDTLKEKGNRIEPVEGGLGSLTRTAVAALVECCTPALADTVRTAAFKQTLRFPYPYWLYEYRRQGFFLWACNLALGCTPGRLLREQGISKKGRLSLWCTYCLSTVGGLLMPIWLLSILKKWLHKKSKAV